MAPQGKAGKISKGGFMKREVYLQELNAVAAENGGMLRPADVVEYAKDPGTALHSMFEWDDTEAAHKYRLQQARQIIRVVTITSPINQDEKVRAFVSLKSDRYNDRGYREMVAIITDEQLMDVLEAEARMEAQVFIDKYQKVKSFAEAIKELQKVVSQPKRKRRSSAVPKYKDAVAQQG